jgi:hypothetical protein
MTFPTSYVRFCDSSVDFIAVCRDLHSPLKQGCEGPSHRATQLEKFAGIGLQNPWHGTRLAQVARPAFARCLQQSALLHVPAAEVVAVEILALFSCWSPHLIHALSWQSRWPKNATNHPPVWRTRIVHSEGLLHPCNVFACTCVYADYVSDLNELRAVHFQPGLRSHLLRHAGSRVAAHRDVRFHDL